MNVFGQGRIPGLFCSEIVIKRLTDGSAVLRRGLAFGTHPCRGFPDFSRSLPDLYSPAARYCLYMDGTICRNPAHAPDDHGFREVSENMRGGLSPISGEAPIVLILGSYPGTVSLAAGEYYANPKNAFWLVMEAVFGVPCGLPYGERTAALTACGIALWDVLSACRRQGSSDASIRDGRANDIPGFLRERPSIRTVALNGRAAEIWLRREHPGILDLQDVAVVGLPSTSPAHARLAREEKIRIWREALAADRYRRAGR